MQWVLNSRAKVKSILVLALNRFTALFAVRQRAFLFWDEGRWLRNDPELIPRMVHYLGGGDSLKILFCGSGQRERWELAGEKIVGQRSASLFEILGALISLRILVGKATPKSLLLQRLMFHKVYVVDWKTEGYRDSAWRWLASTARPDFEMMRRRWETFPVYGDEVVVMGTGPSATMIFEEPFRSLPVIACNTSLKSERLRKHRIAAFCLADALYFLAPTEYGKRFQEMLRAVIQEQRFPVVINAEFYDFCRRRMPFIPEEMLFPLVLNSHMPHSVDFRRQPVAPGACSVFPQLMLPLALNYYQRIQLVGFDGKDPKMKNYFWKHSDEFQYEAELPSVKAHDPGSFGARASDFYDKYNEVYSGQIEELLASGFQRGREIHMAHISFVPALKRLHDAERGAPAEVAETRG
jgi:hypothetical protein